MDNKTTRSGSTLGNVFVFIYNHKINRQTVRLFKKKKKKKLKSKKRKRLLMTILFPQKDFSTEIKRMVKTFIKNKNNECRKYIKRIEKMISEENGAIEELIRIRKNNSIAEDIYCFHPFGSAIFLRNNI